MTQLNVTKTFFKLDTKDGFWSIHLDEASSYLTTFNTHKDRYWFLCFLCSPFRLKMSQDVFQMRMDQIIDRLPGNLAVHDDICVFSCSPEEYNKYTTMEDTSPLKP